MIKILAFLGLIGYCIKHGCYRENGGWYNEKDWCNECIKEALDKDK
jgi:hypothetical protein